MKKLIDQLDHGKIKINWNKSPIKMDTFISFLTIETEISRDHLGASNGWTQRFNNDLSLIIGGGIVNGVNYLDSIQYKKNLQNRYNNYCNPFYLFDIMTDEGKSFFVKYYEADISKLIAERKSKVERVKLSLFNEETQLESLHNELNKL